VPGLQERTTATRLAAEIGSRLMAADVLATWWRA